MQIITRAALAGEKPAIWRLYESQMRHHIEEIWGWDAAWQAADFDTAFATSSTYIVEVDGRLAGYVQLDLGGVENYLRMIILLPGFRSLGIGARLLAEMVRVSRHHRRNLSLRVFRTNAAAKRFYEREGWRAAADGNDFFLMKYGQSVTPTISAAASKASPRHFDMALAFNEGQSAAGDPAQ